jgi:hypothetical protein
MMCDETNISDMNNSQRRAGIFRQLGAFSKGTGPALVSGAGVRAVLALLALMLFGSGCATHPDYATQFRFPIEWGSIARGQQAFLDLQCNQCHVVNGVNLAPYAGASPVTVELGGEIIYAKTYADLVTSIVNPNHEVSESYLRTLPPEERRGAQSIMPFKEQMTVVQLIDLVTFLNSRYVLMDGYEEVFYR